MSYRSFFGSLFSPISASGPPADDDFWYRDVGTSVKSLSGVLVSTDVALLHGTCFGCVRVLSEDVAKVPLKFYERLNEREKRFAPEHPLHDLFSLSPNGRQTGFEFREMMVGHLALRGRFFAQIIAGPRGVVDQLVPLHPDRVEVRELKSGRLVYVYRALDGTERTLTEDEVWHVRGFASDGVAGLDVLRSGREAIGGGIAMQGYAGRFFANDARPGGALKTGKRLSDKAYKRLKEWWRAEHGGFLAAANPAIFEEGLEWQTLGLTNEASQLLESRKFNVIDVCRFFRVKPSKVFSEENSSQRANIEQHDREHVTDTLLPWYVRIEHAIQRDLVIAPRRYFAEHVVQGLLRGDIEKRYRAYEIGIRNEFLNANEVRALESMNPRGDGGGDEYANPNVKSPRGTNGEPRGGMALALALLEDAAARVVRREVGAIRKALGNGVEFEAWTESFMEDHSRFVASALKIGHDHARSIVGRDLDRIIAARAAGDAERVLGEWEASKARALVAAALEDAKE